MTKTQLTVIKRLIAKGEIFCARVMSNDFGKSKKWFDKLVKEVNGEN